MLYEHRGSCTFSNYGFLQINAQLWDCWIIQWFFTKWSQSVRDRQISYDIMHVKSNFLKKIKMNFCIKQKQTYRHWKQTYGYPRGNVSVEGGINQELGMNIHTLLYMRDDQQRPTVQHKKFYPIFWDNLYEKRILERMNVYVCVTESLCCTPETNTTL